MKILSGIRDTGNGHLCRAWEVIGQLARFVEIDVLISGSQYEVDLGADVTAYRAHGLGFTFGTTGSIEYWRTLTQLRLFRLLQGSRQMSVQRYGVVLSDVDPISARATHPRDSPT